MTRRATDSPSITLNVGRKAKRSMAATARALGVSISEYTVMLDEIVGPVLMRVGLVRAKVAAKEKRS